MSKPPRLRHDYVDNKRFYEEIKPFIYAVREVEAQGLGRESWPEIPRYVGKAIQDMAHKYSTKGNFIGYTYRDEMISDAIENCILYVHKFNPDKYNNPFAYFSQIIFYAFIRRIKNEHKEQYIKYKSLQNSAIMNELVDNPGGQYTGADKAMDFNSDKYDDFIKKFETTNIKPKKQKAKKGLENFIDETS